MKTIYQAKYRKGAMKIKQDCLPRFKHINSDFYVKDAEILEAGIVELKDGEQQEYQIIKVFFKEHVIG